MGGHQNLHSQHVTNLFIDWTWNRFALVQDVCKTSPSSISVVCARGARNLSSAPSNVAKSNAAAPQAQPFVGMHIGIGLYVIDAPVIYLVR